MHINKKLNCFKFLLLIIIVLASNNVRAQYSRFFTNERLRLDFIIEGSYNAEEFELAAVSKEKYWSGKQELDTIQNIGSYRVIVRDEATGEMIFNEGFCTLFEEWQLYPEAKSTTSEFQHTVITPFPKNKVIIDIQRRDSSNVFTSLTSFKVKPKRIKESKNKYDSQVELLNAQHPIEKSLDFVFVGEGYGKNEFAKLKDDAKALQAYMAKTAPFDKYINKINFHLINPEVEEDVLFLNSDFDTFNSERYLQTQETFKLRDLLKDVPYDYIYILVNSDKYGGGGIYNHFSIGSAQNRFANELFLHELAHSMAGLADEYFYPTEEENYNNYYSKNHEPWQANLTNLSNFASKWEDMLADDTPIPTPSIKDNNTRIGAYEGGGYQSKFIYRPYINCKMREIDVEYFCPVCERHISELIKMYVE